MIEEKDISDKVAGLQAELKRAFGINAKTLEKTLGKSGRLLPGELHKKAQVIIEAQRFDGNPKLMRYVERGKVTEAYDDIMAYLSCVDPTERRKGTALDILTGTVLTVLITAALLAGVLIWRGFL